MPVWGEAMPRMAARAREQRGGKGASNHRRDRCRRTRTPCRPSPFACCGLPLLEHVSAVTIQNPYLPPLGTGEKFCRPRPPPTSVQYCVSAVSVHQREGPPVLFETTISRRRTMLGWLRFLPNVAVRRRQRAGQAQAKQTCSDRRKARRRLENLDFSDRRDGKALLLVVHLDLFECHIKVTALVLSTRLPHLRQQGADAREVSSRSSQRRDARECGVSARAGRTAGMGMLLAVVGSRRQPQLRLRLCGVVRAARAREGSTHTHTWPYCPSPICSSRRYSSTLRDPRCCGTGLSPPCRFGETAPPLSCIASSVVRELAGQLVLFFMDFPPNHP